MKYRLRSALAALPAAALAAGIATAAPAHALTGPPEPTSMAQGNLFSLGDSDFESGVGNTVSYANATLTQGTGTTMLHNSSLKDTVPATGTTAWRMANGHEITVVPGAHYRIGAYFHSPAVSGDTVTWAIGGYNSSGTWQGWTSGTTDTLANTSGWQYASDVITIPSPVTNVIGVRVTITGARAGDVVRMDEASFASQRAGIAVGSEGNHCGDGTCGSYSATDWLDANATSPPGIGPLQVNKEFYQPGDGLPVFSSSICAGIEGSLRQAQWPVCIIAYKDQVSQAAMTAFMQSVPAAQQVVLVWHQEPEGDFTSGSVFVSDWEAQYAEYKAAGNFANISMDMDSASYPYKNGKSGGCSYIVPGSQTDGYLMDFYESTVDGNAMPNNVDRGSAWTTWLNCVKGNGKPIGIAEEGYDQGTTSNINNTPTAEAADSSYLAGLPDTIGNPVLFRTYWDTNVGGTSGNWMLSDPAEVNAWQAEEALNGGF